MAALPGGVQGYKLSWERTFELKPDPAVQSKGPSHGPLSFSREIIARTLRKTLLTLDRPLRALDCDGSAGRLQHGAVRSQHGAELFRH